MNLYGFAAGDPVNHADPFGLSPCDPPDSPECKKRAAEPPAVLTDNLKPGQRLGERATVMSSGARVALPDDGRGNFIVTMRGNVRVDIPSAPDAIVTHAGVNLGTGGFEAWGEWRAPFAPDFSVKGNLNEKIATVDPAWFLPTVYLSPGTVSASWRLIPNVDLRPGATGSTCPSIACRK